MENLEARSDLCDFELCFKQNLLKKLSIIFIFLIQNCVKHSILDRFFRFPQVSLDIKVTKQNEHEQILYNATRQPKYWIVAGMVNDGSGEVKYQNRKLDLKGREQNVRRHY